MAFERLAVTIYGMAGEGALIAPDSERVLELLPDAVLCIDSFGMIAGAWGACVDIFGSRPEELVGLSGFSRVHADDIAYAAGALLEASSRVGEHVPMNLRVLKTDGRWVLVEMATATTDIDSGEALLLSLRRLAYRGHMDERRDDLERRCLVIASQLAAARTSQLEAELIRAVLSMREYFRAAAISFVCPGARPIDAGLPLKWPDPTALGPDGFRNHGRYAGYTVYEIEFPADGPARWWLAWDSDDPGMAGWDGASLEDLRLAGAIAASGSARLVLEADLVRRARLDPLTGLHNRDALETSLKRMLQVGPVTVLFCDLDNFKQANDSFGHAFGDKVLAVAAERLSRALRVGDVLGRVGGDEFVAACPAMSAADATATVERLERALRAPINIDGQEVTVGVSVGTASRDQGSSPAALIAAADSAMYRVKAFRSVSN